MVKVSIIVPVYNVEKYIDKCLQTLVNQTLEDIEIIIVNDGSTDNSEEIIKQYLQAYKNKIKYVIKENGGLSDARNYGMKYATGEFIAFLDSDDYVDVTIYEKMYKKAIEEFNVLNQLQLIGDIEENMIVIEYLGNFIANMSSFDNST